MPASRWDDLMHNCCEGPLGASVGVMAAMAHGGMNKLTHGRQVTSLEKLLKDPMESQENITGFGYQQLDQSTLLPPLGVL